MSHPPYQQQPGHEGGRSWQVLEGPHNAVAVSGGLKPTNERREWRERVVVAKKSVKLSRCLFLFSFLPARSKRPFSPLGPSFFVAETRARGSVSLHLAAPPEDPEVARCFDLKGDSARKRDVLEGLGISILNASVPCGSLGRGRGKPL